MAMLLPFPICVLPVSASPPSPPVALASPPVAWGEPCYLAAVAALPRCIADLAAMPEAGALLAEAKILLPRMTERIKAQPAKDHAEEDVDPERIIADWCAKQTEKMALCEEAAK